MKSMLRRRPSPALVISCIALFVSLGGVSYGVATGFIDSREIKNNSLRSNDVRNNTLRTFDIRNNEVRGFDIRSSTIQGRDVALNTLTGADIAESALAKVPSAATADRATTADQASSADRAASASTADAIAGVTVRQFAYAGETSAFVEVFNVGGLRLEARCVPGAGPELELRLNPAVANSEISARLGNPPILVDDLDFDPGDDAIVAGPGPVPGPDAGLGNSTGAIAFAGSDGRVVTVQALIRENLDGVRGTTNDCGFFGSIQAG